MADTATIYFVSQQAECMILPLWKQGKDTLDIARALALPESEISNRLPKLLEQQRVSRMPPFNPWTDERVETLKTLWARGFSCSQIAAEIGTVTRNAVIGKIHRLGISDYAPAKEFISVQRTPKEIEARKLRLNERRRQTRRFELSSMDSLPFKPQRPPVCEEVTPRNISLLDLEPNDCRQPYGDGPFTFCGHPKFHGSYCVSHYFASIGQGTASERAATRVSTYLLVRA